MIQQISTIAKNSYDKAKDVMGRVVRLPMFSLILLVIFVVILLWIMIRMWKVSQSAIKQNQFVKIEATAEDDAAKEAGKKAELVRKPEVRNINQAMEPVAPLRPVASGWRGKRPAVASGEQPAAAADEWGSRQNGGCKVCNYFYTK